MILDIPLEQAWAALSRLSPARGTVAGHTGLARLVEADDDTHTAILRLTGTGPNGPATATVTARLQAHPDGTRLRFSTRAHPRPSACDIGVLTAALVAALSRPGVPPEHLNTA